MFPNSLFLSPDDGSDPSSGGGSNEGEVLVSVPAGTPIERAVEHARGVDRGGNPIVDATRGTTDVDVSSPEQVDEHHSQNQPRNEQGEFEDVPPAEGDVEAPADPAVADAVADALDPEAPPAEPEVADGEDKSLTVALPGRNPNDPDFEIAVEDQETAERLNQLRNSAMRGDQARATLEKAEVLEQQAEELKEMLSVDPSAFVLENLSPQDQRTVLLSLLTTPELVGEESKEQIQNLLADEKESRLVAAEIKAARAENREQVKSQLGFARQVRANAADLMSAIQDCVPTGLSGEQREVFIIDARRAVADTARRMKQSLVNPRDVPLMLQQRIRAYGGDPEAVAATIAARAGRSGQPRSGRGSGDRESAPAPARPTGKEFVKARRAKRAGSMTGPAGAGAPPAGAIKPPKGMDIKQAGDWYRKNVVGGGATPA